VVEDSDVNEARVRAEGTPLVAQLVEGDVRGFIFLAR